MIVNGNFYLNLRIPMKLYLLLNSSRKAIKYLKNFLLIEF